MTADHGVSCGVVTAELSSVAPAAEACDMNLGPRQRRRRLYTGIAATVAFAGLAAAFVTAGVSPLVRLTAWPVALLAALGFLQYRART